jgi:GNAT superfamily N-acetyltransferase
MEPEELAHLLTPDWTPDPPGFLMATALRPADIHIAGDYHVTVERACRVTRARVVAGDGSTAARGQVAVTGETCVFDRIETAPEHRRRGLGSAVVAALTTAAADLGAATGILGATGPGRALYETLGWEVLAPLSGFVYQRADGHLRERPVRPRARPGHRLRARHRGSTGDRTGNGPRGTAG